MRVARVLAGAVLLAAATAGCGDDGGSIEVVGTTLADAAEVEIEAFDFGYEPSTLELTAGEPVNLTMVVTGGGHNLRIEGVGFQLPIVDAPDGAVGTLQIDEPGEYRLLCTVPGHEAAGMVGTVVVG
jgi:plastocyanin